MSLLLGLDIGSSSIKVSLVEAKTGIAIATAQSPDCELRIIANQPGWAEQDPDVWWHHVIESMRILKGKGIDLSGIKAIGISYQMHGLVAVDKAGKPVRHSIIWCDSRAAAYGQAAFEGLGPAFCMDHLLNSPGNFTAAKLAWVKENEPLVYEQIDKIMLPGDYIGLKLTGDIVTTKTGLSEGILWDFAMDRPSTELINFFGFSPDLFPSLVPGFGIQGSVTRHASRLTGIPAGTPVCYRAGDQPNNALSLNVLEPGELATTAGTSGVIYGILDQVNHDPQSRVNVFAHVNDGLPDKRLGVLLCINGTGILYSWIKRLLDGTGLTYDALNRIAFDVEPGSDGLTIYPFGNGVERIHQNRPFGGQVMNLDFNRHSRSHLVRAAQEGIVYALNYGFEAMKEMGVRTETVRAGYANLFLSRVFRQIFSDVTGTTIELFDTDGATGAARGAGIGAGIYPTPAQAFASLKVMETINPDPERQKIYRELYLNWKTRMLHELDCRRL
ncbi:MAG: FGGY family carbohydrate kinase [Bacteroidales bacterium]|jgi:xylulokinase